MDRCDRWRRRVTIKYIIFLIFVASLEFVGPMEVEAATKISTERVAPGVRKVIIQQDDGTTVERFELCDKETRTWLPARLDPASNRWILSRVGESAKQKRQEYIRDLHLRWEREERRANSE